MQRVGDRLVVGTAKGTNPLLSNTSAPALGSGNVSQLLAAAGYNHTWLKAKYTTCKLATQTAGMDAVDYAHADWIALDGFLRTFWTKCGFKPLADVPSRCINYLTTASIVDQGGTWVLIPETYNVTDVARAGIMYLGFRIPISSGTSTCMAFVPVIWDERLAVPMVDFSHSGDGTGVRFSSLAHPTSSAAGYYFKAFPVNDWYNVPDKYKTDPLGRVGVSADIPVNLYITKAALVPELKAALIGSTSISLLPLAAPLGEATYFYRGQMDSMVVSTEDVEITVWDNVASEDVLVNLRVTTIDFDAAEVLSAVPTNWYYDYIRSGFGYFVGLGDEKATAATAALADLNAYTHTAVYMRDPVNVPRDIVTRLDVYQSYKKAREKACLSNDFFALKYNDRLTWGQVNEMCNKDTSINVLYGISSVTPSIGYASGNPDFAGWVYSVNKATTPWGLTLFVSGTSQGAVAEEDKMQLFTAIRYGATISGATSADVATNWGLDAGVVAAEGSALGTTYNELNTMSSTALRGRNSGSADFSWETMGISGFPLIREMALLDGYKCIIHSIASVGNRTSNLHTAFLRFGESAYVSDMIQ
jgi:hypothetical protein